MVISPFQQVMVPVWGDATHAPTNGAAEATPEIEKRDSLLVSAALVSLTEGKTTLQITNPHSHTCTLDSCVAVDNFKVMTAQQAAKTKPVPHAHVLLMNNHPEECEHILSQFFHKQTENIGKRWYPTPEPFDDPSKLNKIEKRIYDEIIAFRGKEQLNPTKSDEQRKIFCQSSAGMNL